MAPATRTRRPLPRRVYWFRRLLVLGVLAGVIAAIVLGINRLLDASDSDTDSQQAAPVASSPRPSASEDGRRRDREAGQDRRGKADRKQERGLARPDGPCDDEDVLVTPEVADAHLGAPVEIVLKVTSIEADACYWEVSPESVFLNIDGDYGTIWSSQQCPAAVPTEQVVPRKERAARVSMWWNGKESDDGCPSWTPWVEAVGSYSAVAAARGSTTPVSTGFFLASAVAPTITATPTPTSTPTPSNEPEAEPDESEDEPRRERRRR